MRIQLYNRIIITISTKLKLHYITSLNIRFIINSAVIWHIFVGIQNLKSAVAVNQKLFSARNVKMNIVSAKSVAICNQHYRYDCRVEYEHNLNWKIRVIYNASLQC